MATEITDLIQIPPNKKVVIDFYATWCNPCARVTPIIDDLVDKFENIVFLKVNVDEADEIAVGFEIGSLPTFVYLNSGNIVNRIEGANLPEILKNIEKLDQMKYKQEPKIVQVQTQTQIPMIIQTPAPSKSTPIPTSKPISKPTSKPEKKPEKKEERKPEKKAEKKPSIKIEKKIVKKTTKKKSSRESQKKDERRNFSKLNPYEIEYNNDTPKDSSEEKSEENSDILSSDVSNDDNSLYSIS